MRRRPSVWLALVAVPSVTTTALALPPVTPVDSPWVLDASAGVPRLKGDDLRVAGDATLGYAKASYGLVARGALRYADVEATNALWDSARVGGTAEAWYVSGEPESAARFELRGVGGGSIFSSTYVPTKSAAVAGYFHDEDSLLARGGVLAGARLQPSSTFLVSAIVGGGYQMESYSTVSADPKVNALFSDSTQSSFQAQGRFRLKWAIAPDTLSLRARVDGSYFKLTRDDLIVRSVSAGGGVVSTQATFSATDVTARLFVDIDAWSFAGISPTAFAGIDYLGLSTGAGSTTATVPILGVGVFKIGD